MAAKVIRCSNRKKYQNEAVETIILLEKRIEIMKLKQELPRGDVQSIVRMSKLLIDVNNDFKMYHFAIVDQLEKDTEEAAQQEILDQHDTKVI